MGYNFENQGLVFLKFMFLICGTLLYIFRVADAKCVKVSAKLRFSPNYCSAVAEKAVKPPVFNEHEAISTFLGSGNVLKLSGETEKLPTYENS